MMANLNTKQALTEFYAGIKERFVDKNAIMQGATSTTNGTSGLVPAPQTSDIDKFLNSDGRWRTWKGFSTKEELEALRGANTLYKRPSLFISSKTFITIPKDTELNIDGVVYKATSTKTLQLSSVGSSLAGKDVFINAYYSGSSTELNFNLTLTKTLPDTQKSGNNRIIGGFHCLCADVGTISGHPLSGYVAGDILPASRWDLLHRAKCADPSGMCYIDEVDVWMDIYLASWNGSVLESKYGGLVADGASTKKFHGELFVDEFARLGKRLPWRYEFQRAARGSNENTNVYGSADVGNTGGHKDTANRRMISNYGLEDCCGFMWQWASDVGVNGSTGWNDSVSNTSVDINGIFGRSYGSLYRAGLGGGWANGSGCGSRSVAVDSVSARVYSSYGGRGSCEPKYVKGVYSN